MNYSDNLNKVIQLSKTEAKRLGCSFVTPDHLLLGLLGVEGAKARDVLREAGVDIAEAQHHIEQRNLHTGAEDIQPQFDKQAERILRILDQQLRCRELYGIMRRVAGGIREIRLIRFVRARLFGHGRIALRFGIGDLNVV